MQSALSHTDLGFSHVFEPHVTLPANVEKIAAHAVRNIAGGAEFVDSGTAAGRSASMERDIGINPKMLGAKAKAVASRRHAPIRGRDLPSAPPGHPARGRKLGSRQVSWLTGHRSRPSSQGPETSVTRMDANSPLTVAGAAPVSHRLPS